MKVMRMTKQRRYTRTKFENTKSYEYYLLWCKASLENPPPPPKLSKGDDKQVISALDFVRYLEREHGVKISYQAMYVHLKKMIAAGVAWYTKTGTLRFKGISGRIPSEEGDKI